jgi:hypothetical protein
MKEVCILLVLITYVCHKAPLEKCKMHAGVRNVLCNEYVSYVVGGRWSVNGM